MNLRYGDDKTELIKISPMLLYDIATDIQVTDKWKQFAMMIGFTNEQIAMLQLNCGDRFPAENVIYHWFSKNPKVDNLANHLCTLLLEKSLNRLRNHLCPATYNSLVEKLQNNRNAFTRPINSESAEGYLESIHNDDKLCETNAPSAPLIHQQISNVSTNSTTEGEPGVIDIDLHDSSIPRSLRQQVNPCYKEDNDTDEQANQDPTSRLLQAILTENSINFCAEEFIEIDFVGRSLVGKFSTHFNLKLRSNNFFIRAFSLQKILESTKKKKKIYNIIWFQTHYRLNRFPTFTGFSFYDDYLFLLFPFEPCHNLYDLLHRPHDTEYKSVSALERIQILTEVGEGLGFLHECRPFGGFHGQVTSNNVLITKNGAILNGFDKFCTQHPTYLKGLEIIKKPDIDFEECFRKDKTQYLNLICETWWNVQPSNFWGSDAESFLIKDIVRRNIVYPKQNYSAWTDELNEHIRSVIQQFSENTKDLGSIAEIVDQLSGDVREPIQSMEPPSYESCTEIYSEFRQDNRDSDSDN